MHVRGGAAQLGIPPASGIDHPWSSNHTDCRKRALARQGIEPRTEIPTPALSLSAGARQSRGLG